MNNSNSENVGSSPGKWTVKTTPPKQQFSIDFGSDSPTTTIVEKLPCVKSEIPYSSYHDYWLDQVKHLHSAHGDCTLHSSNLIRAGFTKATKITFHDIPTEAHAILEKQAPLILEFTVTSRSDPHSQKLQTIFPEAKASRAQIQEMHTKYSFNPETQQVVLVSRQIKEIPMASISSRLDYWNPGLLASFVFACGIFFLSRLARKIASR
jgi:hypothetical protein